MGDVLVDVVVEEVADCMGVDEIHVYTGARTLSGGDNERANVLYFPRRESL